MGKGEIARYEQFLLFPQCFKKTSTADTLKPGLVWERAKRLYNLLLCSTQYKIVSHVQVLSICVRPFLNEVDTIKVVLRSFKPFLNYPFYLTFLLYKSFENTVGKGEIARHEQFLPFPQCFLSV